MRLTEAWLSAPKTQQVFALLQRAGHQVYAVGGCVRNALLGAPASDIDMASDARPERVMALAEAAGLKALPTGIVHGTVTVVVEGEPFEITSFRRDVETFGRNATVAFSENIQDDAARRDFTMNALYASAEGLVLDPTGLGLADLAARRLRFVGDAETRIAEDFLRILRFFRFSAWYAGEIEPEALAACAAQAEGLAQLSRERVGAELGKLLDAPDPALALGAMAQSGVLAQALAGAEPRALYPFLHLSPAPDRIARLAALCDEAAAATLRLSKPEQRRHAALRDAAMSGEPPHVLGYRLKADAAQALALRAAFFEQPLPEGWQAELALGAQAQFPLKAADLPLQGPALGAKLKALEALWLAQRCAPSRDDLLKAADV